MLATPAEEKKQKTTPDTKKSEDSLWLVAASSDATQPHMVPFLKSLEGGLVLRTHFKLPRLKRSRMDIYASGNNNCTSLATSAGGQRM